MYSTKLLLQIPLAFLEGWCKIAKASFSYPSYVNVGLRILSSLVSCVLCEGSAFCFVLLSDFCCVYYVTTHRRLHNSDYSPCNFYLVQVEAGFMFSGNVGTGVVLAHKSDGTWSPPSAIGLAGVGFGFMIGAEIKDIVVIVMENTTLDTLSADHQVKVGGQVSHKLKSAMPPFDFLSMFIIYNHVYT